MKFLIGFLVLALSGAAAAQHSLTVLTYNVAGLPAFLSSGNPAENTAAISPLLNDYDVVVVQEDFSYHDDLVSGLNHSYQSPHSGDVIAGDGMNQFASVDVSEFERITWDDCYGLFSNGADCLTPKGFSFSRLQLDGGAVVDLYNLHADADVDEQSNAARASNLLQLLAYIEQHSAGNAVIVAGDTNSRYTRSPDRLHDYIDAGFADAWVEMSRGGDYPASGAPALTDCADKNSSTCERVDKILYRSSAAVTLELQDAQVPSHFVDESGEPLSDHDPVLASFDYTVNSGH